MSVVKFFPIRWFENNSWKSIQVIGRLENQQPVYVRIEFQPYFTIRYPKDIDIENINNSHTFLMNETPIAEVIPLNESDKLYRIYVMNKEDYYNSLKFYKQNGLGIILDESQDIKNKFFAERKINPGSWQQASDLRTLSHNVVMNTNYTAYELEFFALSIVSIEYNVPIPQGKIAFFDIEAISSDNVSFPDAEADQPADNILAFSLVVSDSIGGIRNIIYILTDQELPLKYTTRTETPYVVEIIRAKNEKELIINFFNGLAQIQPNRLVSMNGRHFDLNYIGSRVRALGIKLPSFTPILPYQPYFYEKMVVQTEPFHSVDEIWTLSAPSISQIDLLDFYRKTMPQLGNHKLETLSQTILGKGKTSLSVYDMFMKYRRGTVEDLFEIIDYSITDSILLYELWNASQIDQKLSLMVNEWKNDAEHILTHDTDKLFEDLIRYIQPNISEIRYDTGKEITTERKSGIYHNVYIYSLSPIYIAILRQHKESQVIANYFQNTNDAIVPFISGYYPVTFAQVQEFILSKIPIDDIIWIEKNSIAVVSPIPSISGEQGPINFLPVINYAKLLIISQKSWILVDKDGLTFKKGLGSFVRPPFPLAGKYIDYLIKFSIENPNEPVNFPLLETDLKDFVLENKVTASDFAKTPKRKEAIIQQLREMNVSIPTTWRKVKYLKTIRGNIIEEVFKINPETYIALLDQNYYNKTLQNTLKSVFS
jgi:hypothetical protein